MLGAERDTQKGPEHGVQSSVIRNAGTLLMRLQRSLRTRAISAVSLALAFNACNIQSAKGGENDFFVSSGLGRGELALLTSRLNAGPSPPLISLDENNQYVMYGKYAADNETAATSIVPDFSRAGYRGGGVSLPSRNSVSVKRVIGPQNNGSDSARIQAAIDEVSALPPDHRGLRGAVLLKRGKYLLTDTLRIPVGGVVVRGEGRGENGTVLRSAITGQKGRIIEIGGSELAVPTSANRSSRAEIVANYIPVGAKRIPVASTRGYTVGDQVVLVRHPNQLWLGPEGINTERYGWKPQAYVMYYERVVTAVEDGMLTIDAPVVDAVSRRFGGGSIYRSSPARISEVGVEDIRIEGRPETGTSNGTSDAGPYFGIRIGGAQNSWVRNVAILYVSHGIATRNGAHFNTFQDVSYLEPRYGETQGARRYAFAYEGNASFNLTQRAYAEHARHAFMTGAKVPGPNVFLDCVAVDSTNDSGPHHRWSTGVLYDNVSDRRLRVQNRANSGPGHGWAGAQQMFWNSASDIFVVQAPPFAMNWAVSLEGDVVSGQFAKSEPLGIIEPFDRKRMPRSLYLQQLQDRVGLDAVIRISTPAQRAGRSWDRIIKAARR